MILRGLIAVLAAVLLIGTTPPDTQIQCVGKADFCTTVHRLHQRLAADSWTRWWAQWADDHEVVVEIQTDWTPGRWATLLYWDGTMTIAAGPGIKDDPTNAVGLLHEITHVADGRWCTIDPWAHERVYFWQTLAAHKLGVPMDDVWMMFLQHSTFEAQARLMPYGLTEPCRDQGIDEIAPWGVTYTKLHERLNWWIK